MAISATNLKGKKVILGMSGGVDSAVAALLLKQQGADVQALHMTNWEDDDGYCTAAHDLQDARRVCEQLDIPLHHANFAKQYRDRVFDHFLDDFLEVVKKLCLSQTYARVRVLIADPSRAIKNGNNFVHLGRRLNTYIEFRHVREDLRNHAESFCIADEIALVYRLQADRWEGIADTHEPAVAKLYGKMFDEIWQASEVEIEFRQLGI